MKTYFSLKSIVNNNIILQKAQKKEAPLSARELLMADIVKTQHALETAYAGFDNAVDPDLIDCYIYEVNSALKRYRFLLGQAERMQLFLSDTNTDTVVKQKEIPATQGILSLHHN